MMIYPPCFAILQEKSRKPRNSSLDSRTAIKPCLLWPDVSNMTILYVNTGKQGAGHGLFPVEHDHDKKQGIDHQ